MAETKIDEIKNIIKKEQEERQKLLNHENEITRSAAKELYERYMAASESTRIATYIERKRNKEKEAEKGVRPML